MAVGKQRYINQSMEASCILQGDDLCLASDSIDKIPLSKWKNIQGRNKKWTGLDTFESVFATFDWKLGPTGLFMHDSCYIKLCSPTKLAQSALFNHHGNPDQWKENNFLRQIQFFLK